jgi:hypothetical protein
MTINLESIIDRIDYPYWWWWRSIEPKRFLKHRYQRSIRGFSDEDCWGLYGHLADIIIEGITVLRGPGSYASHPISLNSAEEWDGILNEIKEGFRLVRESEYWYWEDAERKAAQDKVDRAKQLLMEYFEALWD